MLFALLVLSFSNVDATTNKFMVDCRAEYNAGWFWGWQPIEWSGTSCQLCVKNGMDGRTECKEGPDDDDLGWSVNFDYANVEWDTWIWTSCSDALIIDQAWLYDLNNDRNWGRNDGGMWCLSEDFDDIDGWEGYSGPDRCFRLLEFAADGEVYYYDDWIPYDRRAMQDAGDDENVPTADDFNACEADETKTHEQCEDLVDLIFQNAIAHPERAKIVGQEHHKLGLPDSTNFCSNIISNTECDDRSDCFWFSLGSDDGTCEEDNHKNVQKKMYMRTSTLLKLLKGLGSNEDDSQTRVLILFELLHLQDELGAELSSSSETERRSLEQMLERTVVEGTHLIRKL